MQSIEKYNIPSVPRFEIEGEIVNQPLTHQDYERLKTGLKTWRDVLLAKMLRATGARIGEVLKLEPHMCKLEGPEYQMAVKRSKLRKKDSPYEPIYLPSSLGVELRDYIKGNHIAVSQRIFQISYRRVHQIFEQAGRQTLGRPVHVHEFRHLYIKTLIDNGISVLEASKMVGHTSAKTTEKWYFELSSDRRRFIGERMPV